MLDRESSGLILYFLKLYPGRSALIVFLLLLSGLAEGFGIATLIPLLELATPGGASDESRVMELVRAVLARFHLEPTLIVLLGFITLAMALKAGIMLLAMKQVGYTVAQVAADLRLKLLRTLLRARWSYFVGQPAGHLTNAMGYEAHRAAGAYRSACAVLAGMIQVLVYAALATLISWIIAVAGILASAVVTLLLAGFVRMARAAGRRQTLLMASLIGRVTDALQGIKQIKAMGREDHLRSVLESETRALGRAQESQVLAAESLRALQEPLLVLLLAFGLYAAITHADVPFASILVMAFLFYRMVGRVHALQVEYQLMTAAESAFWSLKEGTERAAAEREDSLGDRTPPPLRTGIVLDSLSFSYGDKRVLEGVSAVVPAGKFVAIVGPSGAGKTTLADLILGLHRPNAGEVYVDGVPLGEISLALWRQMIGYVPQEAHLFHETVLRNVTLGDPAIAREKVEGALRRAGAWEFVSRLPGQIDMVVGERGLKLSGGQRQRIAIARALARDPRLLVLDEVTTALDPGTEGAVCETLRHLAGDITIIAISHRSAIVESADLVYRLDRATLTEARSEHLLVP